MKKTVLILLSLVCAYSLSGCSEDTTLTTNIVVPLAIGNEWVYKTIDYHSMHRESDTLYFDTVKIVRSAFIHGDTIYYTRRNVGFANRADGYWGTRVNRDLLQIVFKHPCIKGEIFRVDTFPIIHFDSLGKEITFNVLIKSSCDSTFVPITVPAGSFRTIKYEVNFESPVMVFSQKSIYYVCPGVGIVLSYFYMWDKSFYLARKEELASYHFN
ncbi:MAG TPA: hypothetical protein VIX80_05245 [Candidatus Kapabacteria bacterium]